MQSTGNVKNFYMKKSYWTDDQDKCVSEWWEEKNTEDESYNA